MSLLEDLKRDLVEDEGIELSCYRDSEGYETIGVGRLIDPRKGGGITHEEAMYLLRNDIIRVCTETYHALPWLYKQPESIKRAVLNMSFQLGLTGLLRFKKMLAALEVGNIDEAVLQAYKSKWARQTPARADRVARLFKE